ncbi:MAG: hypothetical protein FD138_4583 [Planctomycetota bacterium]|nr:MAG: hypothetical protein FD138_4583 [Planctomycetota bacterium]
MSHELCCHGRLLEVARQIQPRRAEAESLFRLRRLDRLFQRLRPRGVVCGLLRGFPLVQQVAELRLQLAPQHLDEQLGDVGLLNLLPRASQHVAGPLKVEPLAHCIVGQCESRRPFILRLFANRQLLDERQRPTHGRHVPRLQFARQFLRQTSLRTIDVFGPSPSQQLPMLGRGRLDTSDLFHWQCQPQKLRLEVIGFRQLGLDIVQLLLEERFDGHVSGGRLRDLQASQRLLKPRRVSLDVLLSRGRMQLRIRRREPLRRHQQRE